MHWDREREMKIDEQIDRMNKEERLNQNLNQTEEIKQNGLRDIIDRQEAIEAIINLTDIWVNNLPAMIDKVDAQDALKALPSARKTGKWKVYFSRIQCSECGSISYMNTTECINGITPILPNFCSECGADMRGEE